MKSKGSKTIIKSVSISPKLVHLWDGLPNSSGFVNYCLEKLLTSKNLQKKFLMEIEIEQPKITIKEREIVISSLKPIKEAIKPINTPKIEEIKKEEPEAKTTTDNAPSIDTSALDDFFN